MKHRFKFKISLLYTLFLAVLLAITLTGVLFLAKHYLEKEAENQLIDEVSDFCMDLKREKMLPDSSSFSYYYDDGVVLSIYDNSGNHLEGFMPNDFPTDVPFRSEKIYQLKKRDHYWIYQDRTLVLQEKSYRIRGIYTLDLLTGMINKVLHVWIFFIPLFLFLVGFIGYRMLNRNMIPVYQMTKMADTITNSGDLSIRLPDSSGKDELAYLCQTFNSMLDHLQEMFARESQFTSDAAHELRTPVAVIQAHCEYSLEELPLTVELRKELLIIQKKNQAMSELINQLLIIARAENGTFHPNFEENDLFILAETVCKDLQPKADTRHIQLHLVNELASPDIVCDTHLMNRLLSNLIDNSILYGKEGGETTVLLKTTPDDILIQIRDNGIGISQEEQNKIWYRFYRVDASHSQTEGSGLGLSMVQWIAKLHHGFVDVQSIPEIGSIFSVHLPNH